jgi:hypothetical protein
MALKLRRGLEVITNGMLAHGISGRPADVLRTGAGSFKRVLGCAQVNLDCLGKFLDIIELIGAGLQVFIEIII